MSGQDRLAEVEGRVEAATPGPWDFEASGTIVSLYTDDPSLLFVPHEDHLLGGCGEPSDDCLADAELIANAPADLAWAVAEIKRLRAVLAEWERSDRNAGQVNKVRGASKMPFRAATREIDS